MKLTAAYLGGAWHHAPPPPRLGRQDSINSIEWYAKVRHAPFCKFGTKFEHTNGQNVTEDFFCFWSSPNFGLENTAYATRN